MAVCSLCSGPIQPGQALLARGREAHAPCIRQTVTRADTYIERLACILSMVVSSGDGKPIANLDGTHLTIYDTRLVYFLVCPADAQVDSARKNLSRALAKVFDRRSLGRVTPIVYELKVGKLCPFSRVTGAHAPSQALPRSFSASSMPSSSLSAPNFYAPVTTTTRTGNPMQVQPQPSHIPTGQNLSPMEQTVTPPGTTAQPDVHMRDVHSAGQPGTIAGSDGDSRGGGEGGGGAGGGGRGDSVFVESHIDKVVQHVVTGMAMRGVMVAAATAAVRHSLCCLALRKLTVNGKECGRVLDFLLHLHKYGGDLRKVEMVAVERERREGGGGAAADDTGEREVWALSFLICHLSEAADLTACLKEKAGSFFTSQSEMERQLLGLVQKLRKAERRKALSGAVCQAHVREEKPLVVLKRKETMSAVFVRPGETNCLHWRRSASLLLPFGFSWTATIMTASHGRVSPPTYSHVTRLVPSELLRGGEAGREDVAEWLWMDIPSFPRTGEKFTVVLEAVTHVAHMFVILESLTASQVIKAQECVDIGVVTHQAEKRHVLLKSAVDASREERRCPFDYVVRGSLYGDEGRMIVQEGERGWRKGEKKVRGAYCVEDITVETSRGEEVPCKIFIALKDKECGRVIGGSVRNGSKVDVAVRVVDESLTNGPSVLVEVVAYVAKKGEEEGKEATLLLARASRGCAVFAPLSMPDDNTSKEVMVEVRVSQVAAMASNVARLLNEKHWRRVRVKWRRQKRKPTTQAVCFGFSYRPGVGGGVQECEEDARRFAHVLRHEWGVGDLILCSSSSARSLRLAFTQALLLKARKRCVVYVSGCGARTAEGGRVLAMSERGGGGGGGGSGGGRGGGEGGAGGGGGREWVDVDEVTKLAGRYEGAAVREGGEVRKQEVVLVADACFASAIYSPLLPGAKRKCLREKVDESHIARIWPDGGSGGGGGGGDAGVSLVALYSSSETEMSMEVREAATGRVGGAFTLALTAVMESYEGELSDANMEMLMRSVAHRMARQGSGQQAPMLKGSAGLCLCVTEQSREVTYWMEVDEEKTEMLDGEAMWLCLGSDQLLVPGRYEEMGELAKEKEKERARVEVTDGRLRRDGCQAVLLDGKRKKRMKMKLLAPGVPFVRSVWMERLKAERETEDEREERKAELRMVRDALYRSRAILAVREEGDGKRRRGDLVVQQRIAQGKVTWAMAVVTEIADMPQVLFEGVKDMSLLLHHAKALAKYHTALDCSPRRYDGEAMAGVAVRVEQMWQEQGKTLYDSASPYLSSSVVEMPDRADAKIIVRNERKESVNYQVVVLLHDGCIRLGPGGLVGANASAKTRLSFTIGSGISFAPSFRGSAVTRETLMVLFSLGPIYATMVQQHHKVDCTHGKKRPTFWPEERAESERGRYAFWPHTPADEQKTLFGPDEGKWATIRVPFSVLPKK